MGQGRLDDIIAWVPTRKRDSPSGSCHRREIAVMPETPEQIRARIEERFVKVACSPLQKQPFSIGPESAKRLGYGADEIDALPSSVTESFAGVGNPLGLGEVTLGQVVLDIGSGAGMDSLLAARRVGPSGKVVGVDVTEAMLEKARRNAALLGLANVEFHRAEADRLPAADGTVDVVISNGVFNLCLDKPGVLAEIFRVLKPGGRLQMADMLLDEGVTPQTVERKGAWSD
ncbi:MAG: hypothetical protein NVSMB9_29560 [Isosphaeraceae bacterium]